MLKRWKKLSSKIAFQNPWWSYRIDRFEIPDGHKGEYHYTHTNGSSMVIPVMDDGRIILVKQYRYLCDRESIEFAAGSVKDGHSYEETAALELAEETGYGADTFELCGEFNPYNGVTDEICNVFIARHLHPAPRKRDATEEFELLYLTPEKIDELIAQNIIWDGMTMASWVLGKNLLLQQSL